MKVGDALEVEDLPEGYRPSEAFVIFRCIVLDDPGVGGVRLVIRTTEGLAIHEALGMLEAVAADVRQQFVDSLRDD